MARGTWTSVAHASIEVRAAGPRARGRARARSRCLPLRDGRAGRRARSGRAQGAAPSPRARAATSRWGSTTTAASCACPAIAGGAAALPRGRRATRGRGRPRARRAAAPVKLRKSRSNAEVGGGMNSWGMGALRNRRAPRSAPMSASSTISRARASPSSSPTTRACRRRQRLLRPSHGGHAARRMGEKSVTLRELIEHATDGGARAWSLESVSRTSSWSARRGGGAIGRYRAGLHALTVRAPAGRRPSHRRRGAAPVPCRSRRAHAAVDVAVEAASDGRSRGSRSRSARSRLRRRARFRHAIGRPEDRARRWRRRTRRAGSVRWSPWPAGVEPRLAPSSRVRWSSKCSRRFPRVTGSRQTP